jgi:hypothetical protein
MTNEEMFRPCTLWGQTFDAMDVLSIKSTENNIVIDLDTCKLINGHPIYGSLIKSPFYDECPIESMRYLHEAITTMASAFNAPVLATEEVLAGLPKDANALAVLSGNMCRMKWVEDEDGGYWQIRDGDYYMNVACEDSRDSYFPIKADNCSKTAEYLLQFTLDGKRKETT